MICNQPEAHCTKYRQLWRVCFAASFASLLFAGCSGGEKDVGPTGEVTGSVTLEGKPLTSGSVIFTNYESGSTAAGELDGDGKFKLKNPLPVGKYNVSFEPPAAPQPEDAGAAKQAQEAAAKIPLGYQTATTSGEIREVKEGENSFDFKLRKAGPPGGGGGDGGMYP